MERSNPLVRHESHAPTDESDVAASCCVFAILGLFAPILFTGHLSLASALGATVGIVVGLILAYE